MTLPTVVFDHRSLDYGRLDRACEAWREYRLLLDKLPLNDSRRAACEAGLVRCRRAMDAAAVDLDRQRRAEVETWATRHGIGRINWDQWERSASG
jgi:hypothetical protein